MLKVMPCYFDIDDKDVSTMPIWINLPGLPFEFWNTSALVKIVSKVGKLILIDKVTASRGRLSYAKALVEIDASIEFVWMVKIRLPNGTLREQEIIFKQEPKFYGSCKVFKHSNLGCNYNKQAIGGKGKYTNGEMSVAPISAAHEKNVQGLQSPLKQNGIRDFINQHCIDVMGILEMKLGDRKLNQVMRNRFNGFMQVNNFYTHRARRILISWNPSKIKLEVLETKPQAIHCIATCKRPLWNDFMDFNANVSLPWMLFGDFNNVLKFDEKSNGAEVTHKIKDFANFCLHVGLTDVRSIGCLYTGTNNLM
ncbi:uncharacterized protein LOC111404615 [Olea europaea var. sylvestris]|uniref:uncharacterized protein LOC111404615 n=1 Tax=Olea europaea var. sylvestris TaxID=158386 RepID=UPI000C1CF6BE|nr:uncharacterized protein LOC111404615 [Olea europaea var. sylvestris]